MTALTIRLPTDDERNAVERLKDATGTRTASRAIVRAARAWPDLVDELAAERRKVEGLRTVLSAIVAAEAGLAGAEAGRTSALDAATSALATERRQMMTVDGLPEHLPKPPPGVGARPGEPFGGTICHKPPSNFTPVRKRFI